MKRFPIIAAPIIALSLIVASCSSDKNSSTPAPATTVMTIAAQGNPDAPNADKGRALFKLISSATRSIDIVIYEIGDDTLNSALVAAMKKGVYVRVVLDGYSGTVSTNEGFVSKIQNAMKNAGIDSKYFTPHWSSNNFNITHQKSVMIDAVDASGAVLSPMPSSAALLISTGNFSTYSKPPAAPQLFYQATDFYVTVADQTLITQATNVFNSDFSCAGSTVNNVEYGTQGTAGPLLWSNGSWATAMTGVSTWNINNYPGYPAGYPYPMMDVSTMANQGNVTAYQTTLVNSTVKGDVIRIYNEEFASDTMNGKPTNPVFNAIVAAIGRGVDVRVVMSYSTNFTTDLTTIAEAGGTVYFIAPEQLLLAMSGYTGPTYVHAKAIMINGFDGTFKQGYVGSTNLENSSMFENRELGIAIGPANAAAARVITAQFDSDASWVGNSTAAQIYGVAWTKGSEYTPAAWAPASSPSMTTTPQTSQPNKTCGVVVPTK